MSATEAFWAAPPVSRTLTLATLVLSLLVHGGLLDGYYVIFHSEFLFKIPPEIWRILSSFMITGPQMQLIFDTYFLWTYSSKLETGSPRYTRPGDYFTYILFVCSVILALNIAVTGGLVFTSALTLALAYTWAQDNRHAQASIIIFPIPAVYLPYAMLAMTLVMGSPQAAMIQGTGLIAAHLYDFLTRIYPEFGGGRNFLETPTLITRIFERSAPAVNHRAYGTAFAPAQRQAATASGSSGGGVLPESWKSRGTGRRLGGD